MIILVTESVTYEIPPDICQKSSLLKFLDPCDNTKIFYDGPITIMHYIVKCCRHRIVCNHTIFDELRVLHLCRCLGFDDLGDIIEKRNRRNIVFGKDCIDQVRHALIEKMLLSRKLEKFKKLLDRHPNHHELVYLEYGFPVDWVNITELFNSIATIPELCSDLKYSVQYNESLSNILATIKTSHPEQHLQKFIFEYRWHKIKIARNATEYLPKNVRIPVLDVNIPALDMP